MPYSPASLIDGPLSDQNYIIEIQSMNESLLEEVSRIKSRNRILVTVNRVLQERIKELQADMDDFVQQLADADEQIEQEVLDEQADLDLEALGLPITVSGSAV